MGWRLDDRRNSSEIVHRDTGDPGENALLGICAQVDRRSDQPSQDGMMRGWALGIGPRGGVR